MMKRNTVIYGDAIQEMRKLPDNSVDIIIADPPYNVSKGGTYSITQENKPKGFGGNWNKVMESWDDYSLQEYFTFSIDWLTEAKRILKDTGSIWIFGTYHNIGIINFVMQILKFEIINEVIWYKRNSFPNLSGRRLTASHETILWGHSGKSNSRLYNFNYENSKCLSYPEDNLKKPDKQMRTVWDIPNNKQKEELIYGKHPTQKPIRVLKRMLELSAKKDDLVFSPFSGSGSELVAAKSLGLDYLGIEKEEEFFKLSLTRLEHSQKGNFFDDKA
ncbi:DNA-methyltransferase [Streptococcus intermedius]|uniref:DNA-methyltransferase n=2 Tax=Streptococcus TaxID=1301 RepID=UPI0019673FE3|nr:site-specific DNA-methyltransferase [Streptococcus intermedius]